MIYIVGLINVLSTGSYLAYLRPLLVERRLKSSSSKSSTKKRKKKKIKKSLLPRLMLLMSSVQTDYFGDAWCIAPQLCIGLLLKKIVTLIST